jgi:hypothetical protein
MSEELVSLIAELRREAGDAAITASQELARLLHDAADELERLAALVHADNPPERSTGDSVASQSKPGDTSE